MQITELNGVGPKTAALLKKLKIETVEDLFLHYPRRYETHPAPVPISQIVENQKCAVQCVVKKEAVKGNNGLMTLYISDRSGRTSCKWFQNPWINKIIKVGREYVFFLLLLKCQMEHRCYWKKKKSHVLKRIRVG